MKLPIWLVCVVGILTLSVAFATPFISPSPSYLTAFTLTGCWIVLMWCASYVGKQSGKPK